MIRSIPSNKPETGEQSNIDSFPTRTNPFWAWIAEHSIEPEKTARFLAFLSSLTVTSLVQTILVMSREYDGRTTTFSPEGRLYQVEYAMEAINNAACAIGVLTKEGVVFGIEKKMISKLLAKVGDSEKVYPIDDHIMCAIAGLTSDANILLQNARKDAQDYLYKYGQPKPVEELVEYICRVKHSYTQVGGLRPFGVSFLFAGWDKESGYQLYHSDPQRQLQRDESARHWVQQHRSRSLRG